MTTLLIVIPLLASYLSAQSVSISGKVTLSGKVQVSSTESCIPTSTQLANRTSTSAIAVPTQPALPAAGHSYCDPTYGTRVLRVSDDAYLDNSVSVVGAVAWNKSSTRLATIVTGGLLRTYSVNPTAFTSSAGTTIYPIVNAVGGAALSFNSAAFFWSLSSDSDAADTLLIVSGMSVYKLNVTTPPVSGNYQAYKIADLSSLVTTLWNPFLQRCSASSDTGVIGCSIELGASDPGGHEFARVGYVVFTLPTQSTASPTTNWAVKAKFVNGVDSATISDYQSVTRLSANDGVTWTYQYTSVYEQGIGAGGGYKFYLDRTGRYILFSAYTSNDAGYTSGRYNPQVVVDMNGSGASAITFTQGGGHGDPGYGTFVGENTSYGLYPAQMKLWTLASMTTDPGPDVVVNNGVALTAYLGYTNGRGYNNNFANNNLSVVVFSCATGGCSSPPDAYIGDVWTVNITGYQITKRLARIHYLLTGTQYAELQPVVSLDGTLVAFTTNYQVTTTPVNTNYVMVTRMF